MQFSFPVTTTREALQELPGKAKRLHLQSMVDRALAYRVAEASTHGKSSYVWEITEDELNPVSLTGHPPPTITLEELIAAVRARYPGCSVQFGKCHKSSTLCGLVRTLRTGIKVEWA